MEGVDVQPHIQLRKGDVPPVVLVVGDPARLDSIGKMCTSWEEVAYNREYRTVKCTVDGVVFFATSHGVGSAGAAVCFEELIKCGVKVIIRAGTCGSMRPASVKQGDVVIVYAAVREDGASARMVPLGYPAVCDPAVYSMMVDVAKDLKIKADTGMTLTSDLFYPSPLMDDIFQLYSKANVKVLEMEVSTLFVCGKLKGVKTGAILAVDGCPMEWTEGNYDPSGDAVSKGKNCALQIAIESCVRLTKTMT